MKNRFAITSLVFFITFISANYYAQSSWKKLSDLPESINIVRAFAIHNKIYCLSTDWMAYAKPRTIYEYNINTDTWTKKASMPDKRFGFVLAMVNDKIYAVGGSTSDRRYSNVVNEYNPETNEWSVKNNMPTSRGDGLSYAVLDNKIYVIGGNSGNPRRPVSTVEMYDPIEDKWEAKKSLSVGKCFVGTFTLGNKIYAFNGYMDGQSDNTGPSSIVEVFDPQINKWIQKKSQPLLKSANTHFVIGKKMYAICGPDSSNNKNYIVEYNPVKDESKIKKTSEFARYNFPAVLNNNRIYVAGGPINSDWNIFTNKVEYYDPAVDSWIQTANLSKDNSPALITIGNKIYAIDGNNKSLEVYDTKDEQSTDAKK